VTGRNSYGQSILHFACKEEDNLDMIKFLVEKGANLMWVDKDKDTLLFQAAKSGDINLVRYLLSQNLPADALNKNGESAAVYVKREAKEVLKELVRAGAPLYRGSGRFSLFSFISRG